MSENLSITVPNLAMSMLTSLSVDEILLPRYVNWSTYFSGLALKVDMASSCLKHMNSVLFTFALRPMPLVDACARLCNKDSV